MDKMLPQFNVVPCRGKIPLVKWQEFVDKPVSSEDVQAWAQRFPNSDRGIVCGPVSRLFVLDDDGSEELKKYRIPRTATVSTPRGGRHHYFKWTEALDGRVTTKAGILDKVDVRGHGGFVAFYGWTIPPHLAPLASPPAWLIDLLPKKDGTAIKAGIAATVEGIRNGNRNQTFASLAGSLRGRGYSVEEIYTFLESKAKEVEFPLNELRLVCQSIGRYPVPEQPKPVDPKVSDHSFKSFMAVRRPIEWLVPGLIGQGAINVWAGLQESRKSWLLLDLAVAVATGTTWLGKYPCGRGKVIIIDQERPGDEMKRRLNALVRGRDLQIEDVEGYLIPKADLDPGFKLNQESSFLAFEQLIADVKPNLILLDSLKTIQTGDIKDSNSMQPLFEKFKALRQKYKTAFVILHHENNRAYEMIREKQNVTAETIEGSSSIKQVPEGIVVARNFDDESTMVHHVKNSYGGHKLPPFLVRVVDREPDGSKIVVQAY